MICGNTKDNCSTCFVKRTLERWTNHQHNDRLWIVYYLFDLNVVAFVFLVTFTIAIYFWFTRYKLKGILRISLCFLVYNTITLWIQFDEIPYLVSTRGEKSSLINNIFVEKYKRFYFSLVLTIVLLLVRYVWGLPVNFIKHSSSVGFSHLKLAAKFRRQTIRELSDKMLRHRDPGELNPVYVNGWIPLIESKEVDKKIVVSVIALGYKFCVFRGENGKISVMDAYCPHMGADLSAGGQVIGNCIECPFHGWQFCGESGQCTEIPYTDKIPNIAQAKVWASCERNGFVFVWHHAENDPPSWEIPSIPEIEDGSWVYRGRSELTVHCHIQEIPENGADIAHLRQVHSRLVCFGPQVEKAGPQGRWVHHDWQPKWTPDENEPHIAKANILQKLLIFGYEVPWTRIDVNITQIGPATVFLHVGTNFGRGVFCQYIISEGPLTQRIVHLFYTEPKFRRFPASFLMWGESVMIQRDIQVWNNKKFLKSPLLVKEDKLILKFRRWFSQFYSEHSPTLRDLRQKSLDW